MCRWLRLYLSICLLGGLAPQGLWAWEARLGAVCTLDHVAEGVTVRLTHDPALPEYSLALTLSEGRWPDAASFVMTFTGAGGLTIGTDRHVLSEDGRTLTVADRGFGNVIAGLAGGGEAIAVSGETSVRVPLAGAAGPVEIYARCLPLA